MAKSGELQELLLGCLAEHDPHMHKGNYLSLGKRLQKASMEGQEQCLLPSARLGHL